MKWKCTVCGYIAEGDQAPAECPICHVGADKFEKVVGELKLAAEHEYGIYAKTVKNNPEIPEEDKKFIFEQLMANFNGECSEVGMYLCMARIAELLGEDLEPMMTTSTKKNLAWRVECEYGATEGKFKLASIAKKYNLDAIHDTVHEMARDEARHGKGLEGLLNRLFK